MPGWTNIDGTQDDKPKFIRNTAVYNYNGTDETTSTHPSLDDVVGADPTETAANAGISHSGWVLKKSRTRQHVFGGSSNSATNTQYETLVALSEMTSAVDHDEAGLAPWTSPGSSSSSSGTIDV